MIASCAALFAHDPVFAVSYPNDLSWQQVTGVSTKVSDHFPDIALYSMCSSDNECDSSFIKQICLTCAGGKIVFSKGCQSAPGIAQAPKEQGLCVQEHMLGGLYNAFYSGQCMPAAAFCLMNIGAEEVPTSQPESALKFYPVWKDHMMKRSGISQEYFNKHIRIHSVDGQPEWPGLLNIRYYFSVDWITILNLDQIGTNSGEPRYGLSLNHAIESIIPRAQAESVLKQQCDPGMRSSPERDVSLNAEGRLVLRGWAVVDHSKNLCKEAEVDLEKGDLLFCKETACWIN